MPFTRKNQSVSPNEQQERLPVLTCHYLYHDAFLLGLRDTIVSFFYDQVLPQHNLGPLHFVQPEMDPGTLLLMDYQEVVTKVTPDPLHQIYVEHFLSY